MTIRVLIQNLDQRPGVAIKVVPCEVGQPPDPAIPAHTLYAGDSYSFYVHFGQQLLVSEVKP